MSSIISKLKTVLKNQSYQPKIVFAEGWNSEIQKAAKTLLAESKIIPLLIFKNSKSVPKNLECEHIAIDSIDISKYADYLFELRKAKGLTIEQATNLAKQPNYLASLLVKLEEADGEICGIEYTTKDTLVPALQIVKTAPGCKLVTSAFLMEKGSEQYVMGDCAININPTFEELANITKMIAIFSEKVIGLKDKKVVLLSYSTAGSGAGESVEKVRKAYELVKEDPDVKDFDIFGEIQFDAAFDLNVMHKKVKELEWDRNASVYIFPNIDAGNIGYKIAQRMGKFAAIGPTLIGLDKPVNDLSRGASAEDVINLAYITANQVIAKKSQK